MCVEGWSLPKWSNLQWSAYVNGATTLDIMMFNLTTYSKMTLSIIMLLNIKMHVIISIMTFSIKTFSI
jgi:hypothetical protein